MPGSRAGKVVSAICALVGVAVLGALAVAEFHGDDWSVPQHLGWPSWMGAAGVAVLFAGLEMGRRAGTPGLVWLTRRWWVSFLAGFACLCLGSGLPVPIVSTAAVRDSLALQVAIALLIALSWAGVLGGLVALSWELRRQPGTRQ